MYGISLLIEIRSPGGPEGAYYLCIFNINDGNYYYSRYAYCVVL